ncbi:MAG: 1-acyl-sn-glycerol-3-phosphate acyltransferase, partial [Aestuariibacter sp.]|nr:1-acyl-sn-glycerol-3-phosphate acyltransferase [Aestuariibacter sp.]
GKPLQQPGVVIANHPGLLDFIVFLQDFPNAVCLYKSQSLQNPVLSSFVQVAGYIEGMDGTPAATKRIIAACRARLKEGHQVVLFPEGTRSPDAISVRKFRTTGFHAVIKSRAPLQPVAIYYQPLLLGKGQRWMEFCQSPIHVTIRYLSIIHTEDLPEEKQTAAELAKAAHKSICDALDDMAAQ